jgi:hypothetical protein
LKFPIKGRASQQTITVNGVVCVTRHIYKLLLVLQINLT